MAIDGFEWDAPDTKENAAAFGFTSQAAGDPDRPACPKARVVTVSECGSHAVVDAEIGGLAGKAAGEQALARKLGRADDHALTCGRLAVGHDLVLGLAADQQVVDLRGHEWRVPALGRDARAAGGAQGREVRTVYVPHQSPRRQVVQRSQRLLPRRREIRGV
jgi:hypothetical protein